MTLPTPSATGPATTWGTRRPWGTVVGGVVVAVLGVVALLVPSVLAALERDPAEIADGQWWRPVTAMLVQAWWLQYAFNLAGLLLVGWAVERRWGTGRWLVVAVGGGLVAALVLTVAVPDLVDSGTSDAVGALIGFLVVRSWRERVSPPFVPAVYAVFWLPYVLLTGVDVGYAVAGPVASVVVAVVTAEARRTGGHRPRTATLVLAVVTAVVLSVLLDGHGIGLAAGLLAGALLPPRTMYDVWERAAG